jgi:dihydroorotate dehydrogenase
MSVFSALYPTLKPLLFRLEPELAHTLTVRMLILAHKCGLISAPAHRTSSVNCLGLTFPNVLGLAAGMDKSASAVDAWGALGFGFVEVGTLTPRPQPGNPKPRLFRLPEHSALINRMGFNNVGIQAAVKRLERRKTRSIVGVNIGKNFDTPLESATADYVICLRAAYHTADYIAVNISSPNTKGLRDLQAEETIRQLVSTLQQEQVTLTQQQGRRVPIVIKIAPDLEELHIQALARVFNELGVDGIIATNTTISRTAVASHRLAKETGGLSGAPVTQRSTEVIRMFRELLAPQIPIIGVGGIMAAADAQTKLQAGASLVQIYSGLIYAGPGLIENVLQGCQR